MLHIYFHFLHFSWKWGRPWLISSRGSFGAWKPRPRPSTGRPSPESQPSCYTSPTQRERLKPIPLLLEALLHAGLSVTTFCFGIHSLFFSTGSHTSTLRCHRVSTSLGTFFGRMYLRMYASCVLLIQQKRHYILFLFKTANASSSCCDRLQSTATQSRTIDKKIKIKIIDWWMNYNRCCVTF